MLSEGLKQYMIAILTSVYVYVAPIKMAIIATICLVLFDTITGVYAAYRKGVDINSEKLRRTITKFFVYFMAILTAFIVERELIGESVPLVKLITTGIGTVEGLSILENLNKIQDMPLLRMIIEKLQPMRDNKDKDK